MNFRDLYRLNLHFVNIGGYVKYLLYSTSLKKTLKLLIKNEELIKDRKYDTCYICGLGPSLNDVNLDALQDMSVDTLVVNHFYKMANKTKLKPTYYMITDAGFLSHKHRSAFQAAIETYPNTNFIWNTSFQRIDKSVMTIPCKKYFMAMYKGYYIKPKKINIKKVTPAFGNCICAAIGFAIGVGYKKIVLLGCDFNSFAFPHEIHCYDGGVKGISKRRISLDYELFCYSFDATVHMKLAEFAQINKIEILNATRGSLIDAYSRVDMSN